MNLKQILLRDRASRSPLAGTGYLPVNTGGRGAVQFSIMKTARCLILASAFTAVTLSVSSCSPKYGCPSNGKNVGAERILSGEKVPRAGRFKS